MGASSMKLTVKEQKQLHLLPKIVPHQQQQLHLLLLLQGLLQQQEKWHPKSLLQQLQCERTPTNRLPMLLCSLGL